MPRCTPTSALSEFVRMRDYARYFKASWRVTEGRPILVLQEASWKGGELRMCLREPFENLILSNRASRTNGTDSNEGGSNFDNWRATMDTFRTFLASEDHKNQCLEPG